MIARELGKSPVCTQILSETLSKLLDENPWIASSVDPELLKLLHRISQVGGVAYFHIFHDIGAWVESIHKWSN
jgi:hypothetical protein